MSRSRRRRENIVVVLVEGGADQSGGKPSKVPSRHQLRKFLSVARQVEAPCRLKHLLVGVGKCFVPDQLDLADKDIGSDRPNPAELLKERTFPLDVTSGSVAQLAEVAFVL